MPIFLINYITNLLLVFSYFNDSIITLPQILNDHWYSSAMETKTSSIRARRQEMYTGYTKCGGGGGGGRSGKKARANGKKKSERKKLRLLASTRFAQTL